MSAEQAEQDTGEQPQNEGQKGVNREARRIVGEIVVLLVFLGFDAVEVFPSNHLLALLGAVVGISGVAFMEMPTKVWAITTIALAAVAAVVLLKIPTSTKSDRPKLVFTSLFFANNAPLQPGPINLQWIVTNNGKQDAVVTDGRTTTAFTYNGGRLPDAPRYPKVGRNIRNWRLASGTSSYGYGETQDLKMTADDVSRIKAGTERLYYYGYLKYGANAEYAFIWAYDPKVNAFVWEGDEYPTYVRAE